MTSKTSDQSDEETNTKTTTVRGDLWPETWHFWQLRTTMLTFTLWPLKKEWRGTLAILSMFSGRLSFAHFTLCNCSARSSPPASTFQHHNSCSIVYWIKALCRKLWNLLYNTEQRKTHIQFNSGAHIAGSHSWRGAQSPSRLWWTALTRGAAYYHTTSKAWIDYWWSDFLW